MTSKVTNEVLLREVIHSREVGKVSDELAEMFIQMADRYSKRAIFANYPCMDECKAHALMQLSKIWNKFDPEEFDNAWAYYQTVIGCSFAYVQNKECKQQQVKKDYADSLDDGNKP